jgi:hypothetical protein
VSEQLGQKWIAVFLGAHVTQAPPQARQFTASAHSDAELDLSGLKSTNSRVHSWQGLLKLSGDLKDLVRREFTDDEPMNHPVLLRVQLFELLGQFAVDNTLLCRQPIDLTLGHDWIGVCLKEEFLKKLGRLSLQLVLKDQAYSKTSIDNGRGETNVLNEKAVLPRSLQEFRSPDEPVHELTNSRFSRHHDFGGS